jgi:hypothetical protein
MNIADALNPFFYQHDTDPIRDPATHLISQAGQTTIYSAVNEVTISNKTEIAQYATIVKDENDLIIYGLDVTLATDLLHEDRSASASRNISIFCRKLTILGTDDKGLTIDVSGYVNESRAQHIQPDKTAVLSNPSQKAAAGDDIAYALNNPTASNPWSNWFDQNPGEGWSTPGAKGGEITIACETLVLHHKLYLKTNGAKGNAGIGGQNVKNWMSGLHGGDAGKGGSGGDSGTIKLTYNAVVDKDNKPLNIFEWVKLECEAGESGEPGLPGSAYDAGQKNYHYGSYAGPVAPGASFNAEMIQPDKISYSGSSGPEFIDDVSVVGSNCDLHFWGLLYHRFKLEYLKNQPLKFVMPGANDPNWIALGNLATWANRFCFPYGDTTPDFKENFLGDVANDPLLEGKNTIARALKLMTTWYLSGKTMWGSGVTTVPTLPFETLTSCVDNNFIYQKDVRDFYIRLRTELANAIKSNEDVAEMSNAAEYAVQMHKVTVEGLKKILFGSTDEGQVDALSLLGELNAADSTCNTAINKLSKDLETLDGPIKKAIGIGVSDVLDSLKSMFFVLSDPPALIGMAGAEGFGLYDKAMNNVTDDSGNSMAKDAVIKKIHNLKGGLDELSNVANGMVKNNQVGRLDQAIVTSLDNINAYVSKFTKALGDAGTDVLDEIDELRRNINYKNDIWMEYNDRLYQLAKEWEEYQTALAKKQHIDTSSQQELSANLINAVQLYTSIYLNNLERTADLRAQMVRKFAYVTLNADLPDDDFLGNVSNFWNADRNAAQGIADQADGNWDIDKSVIMGSNRASNSIRYQLMMYNAGSQAILIKAPDDEIKNMKSTFYISLTDQKAITKLLNHAPIWVQVVPPPTFQGQYTDAKGEISDPPAISKAVVACPLIAGRDWDVRVTHVNPWIQGVQTETGIVQFHIKLGTHAYIVDSARTPRAHYIDYNEKAVNTQFAHLTVVNNQPIEIDKASNEGIAGDAAGEVSDENIDKRGIFIPLQLSIPEGGLNQGLKALKDSSQVHLRVHFRVIFRASVSSLRLAST